MKKPSSSGSGEPARLLHPRWMLASGNFLFHIRNGLFPVIFLTLALFVRPSYFMGDPALDRMVMIAGAIIALTGQFIRLFVIGYAYIRRGGKNRRIYADDLVVAGIYAHSRNPMYVGNFLIACGFSLYFGNAWVCAITIPFFAWVYLAITAAEEQFLFGKFGPAYEKYMQDVNRFIPDVRGLSDTLGGQRFRWRTVLAKEYGTLFSTLVGLTAIAMYKTAYIHGWEARKAEVMQLAWLFIPIVLFYIIVRYMKLSGRLKEPETKPEAKA